jgi:hypothetical protein
MGRRDRAGMEGMEGLEVMRVMGVRMEDIESSTQASYGSGCISTGGAKSRRLCLSSFV